MNSVLNFIEKKFGFILLAVGIISYLFPQIFQFGKNFPDIFLMFSLFLGCLKIEFSEIFHLKDNFLKLLFFVITNVLIFPILFYILSFNLDPEVRLSLTLLLATSGAVVTPLLSSFLGLKILWSTIFVVLTSALVPFTLPILVELLFGISIDISVMDMSLFLIKIIFIPAILAILVKYFLPKFTQSSLKYSGSLGCISMAIFEGILVSKNEPFLSEHLMKLSTFYIILLLLGIALVRFLIGFCMPFKNVKERWTNSLMFGYTNNGIVILLATKFLTEKVLFVVLLSIIPYVLGQPIFQKIFEKSDDKQKIV